MSRKGLNIYKRKDGRWEARYIKSRTAQGKPLYGYLYASSYHEARNRLQDVIRLQGNAPNSKEMSKGSVFEFFSIEWLDTFSTSFKVLSDAVFPDSKNREHYEGTCAGFL